MRDENKDLCPVDWKKDAGPLMLRVAAAALRDIMRETRVLLPSKPNNSSTPT